MCGTIKYEMMILLQEEFKDTEYNNTKTSDENKERIRFSSV